MRRAPGASAARCTDGSAVAEATMRALRHRARPRPSPRSRWYRRPPPTTPPLRPPSAARAARSARRSGSPPPRRWRHRCSPDLVGDCNRVVHAWLQAPRQGRDEQAAARRRRQRSGPAVEAAAVHLASLPSRDLGGTDPSRRRAPPATRHAPRLTQPLSPRLQRLTPLNALLGTTRGGGERAGAAFDPAGEDGAARRRTGRRRWLRWFLWSRRLPTKEATMPMIVAPRLSTSDERDRDATAARSGSR